MKLTSSGGSKRMTHLSDDEVLANIGSVIGSRRKITAQLVAYLGEVEVRRLHLREACSSMYEFCCRKLKLSEGSAHRHIAAARIARSYPMALDLLRKGRIHVTALSMLQTYLTVRNHADLLAEACDKSKTEVQLLIRSRFPRPDIADAIRPVPVQARLGSDTATSGQSVGAAAQSVAADSGPAAVDPAAAGKSAAGVSRLATAELYEPRSRVSPLSAQRFHVQFSAGTTLRDKLERALDLMSHSNPRRDLATIIERGLDLVLAELEKKKLGKTERPRRSRGTKHGDFSRRARREIYQRDGEQCTYVSPSGERCRARAFVQLDHENPRACGGAGTTDNGRLLCRAHNLFEAEKVFGREYVESRIRLRQQRLDCESRRAAEATRVVQTGDRVGPESPRESGVQEAGNWDSVNGGIRPRQRRLDCESRSGHRRTSGGGDANPHGLVDAPSCRPVGSGPPTLVDAPSCRPVGSGPPTLVDAPSCRPVGSGPPTLVDAPSCRPRDADATATSNAYEGASNDAWELRASEPLGHFEHLTGEAAELGWELSPRGEKRDRPRADSAEMQSKLLSALTNMGFRHRESKKAVAALAWPGDSRSQCAEHLTALVRQALAILVP